MQLRSELLPFITRDKVRPQFRFVRTKWHLSEKEITLSYASAKSAEFLTFNTAPGNRLLINSDTASKLGSSPPIRKVTVYPSPYLENKRKEFVIIRKAKEPLLWGKE